MAIKQDKRQSLPVEKGSAEKILPIARQRFSPAGTCAIFSPAEKRPKKLVDSLFAFLYFVNKSTMSSIELAEKHAMSQSHAEQLQQDLETLRSVVGTELPFDKTDAKFVVAIGLSALAPAVAGMAGARSPGVLLASSAAFVVLVVATVVRGYLSTHPSKSCSRSKRREFRPGIWIDLALFPMIGGYCWWASSLDVPAGARNGTVMMFLGVIVAIGAISDPKRYANWCVAIPAIIGGALWPHLEYFQFWTLLWLSVGLGAIAAGLLMLRQFNGQEMKLTSEES